MDGIVILQNGIIIILVKIIVDFIGKYIEKKWLPVVAGVIATILVVVYSIIALHLQFWDAVYMIVNSTAYTTYVHDFIKKVILQK